MTLIGEIMEKTGRLLSILADWILILVGGALIVKAVVAVDVMIARYVIIVLGLILAGFGFWYRFQRKKRK